MIATKRLLIFTFLMVIALAVMAQGKKLTLEDAVYMNPKVLPPGWTS